MRRVEKLVVEEPWLDKVADHGIACGRSAADADCDALGLPGCASGFARSFGAVAGIAGAPAPAAT